MWDLNLPQDSSSPGACSRSRPSESATHSAARPSSLPGASGTKLSRTSRPRKELTLSSRGRSRHTATKSVAAAVWLAIFALILSSLLAGCCSPKATGTRYLPPGRPTFSAVLDAASVASVESDRVSMPADAWVRIVLEEHEQRGYVELIERTFEEVPE